MRRLPVAAAFMILLVNATHANPPLPKHNPNRQDSVQKAESLPPLPRRKPGRQTAPPNVPAGDPCGGALKDFAINADRLPPITEGECGRGEVLVVTAVGTDTAVSFAAPATFSCNMTIAMAKWIGEAVIPAARKHLGTDIAEIPAGTSYACRNRNNQADAKLSEHAFANAYDLSGFKLTNGEHIAVKAYDDDTPQAEFLAEIRAAACGPFTTVLGPGANEYHSDHFHLDTAERRNPYCQ